MENLKELSGTDGMYFVSSKGLIYRGTEDGLSPIPLFRTKTGFIIGNLYGLPNKRRVTFYLQSIVMSHFGEERDKTSWAITHINNDKSDNRVENLKWIPKSEIKRGNPESKPVEVYNPVTGTTSVYKTTTLAAKALGLNQVAIRDLCNGSKKMKRGRNKDLIFKRI